jgi:hypothetical protein
MGFANVLKMRIQAAGWTASVVGLFSPADGAKANGLEDATRDALDRFTVARGKIHGNRPLGYINKTHERTCCLPWR